MQLRVRVRNVVCDADPLELPLPPPSLAFRSGSLADAWTIVVLIIVLAVKERYVRA